VRQLHEFIAWDGLSDSVVLHLCSLHAGSMLALTIFREELNMKMLMLFTALIFIKLFHWLAAMRVEAIARSEVMARWQHIRLVALLAFLCVIDWAFVISIAVVLLRNKAASVLLLFGFEFLILSVGLASIFIKYTMLQLDSRWEARGQHWHNKNTWSAAA
jgi:E3 ubiquitin-protein ligase synoviolin